MTVTIPLIKICASCVPRPVMDAPYYDVIGAHCKPAPWWAYRVTKCGYALPEKFATVEEAIAWVSKQGGQVQNASHGICERHRREMLTELDRREAHRQACQWDESQCGGVFDGHQVTSDADPGL